MRALRTATSAAGVVAGVVAWITLVPLYDLLRTLVRAASGGTTPSGRSTRDDAIAASDEPTEITGRRIDRAA